MFLMIEKHSAKEWFYSNNNSLLLDLTFCEIFTKHQRLIQKNLSLTLLQLKVLPHSEFSLTNTINIKLEKNLQ